ncbi:MAG: TonB-dependent receptor, partial [Acidobacteriota bacterium]|nr:TonB-dependent receptor [Acidobacteriota bacterium]
VVAGLLAFSLGANGADLALPVTGNVFGSVLDTAGAPQMGASIQLFNKFERLIAKARTGIDGRFAFAGIPADSYSIRVSATSYLPALSNKIAVKAGMDSMLQIHLATLFSNVELSYTVPTGAMSGDWKWVLRSSPATRPITRLLGDEAAGEEAHVRPRIFSGTHAMVSISGGDSSLIDSDSAQSDMGTGFILSTNILGKNQIQVGGNYAESPLLGPAAMSLCAIYTREPDGNFLQAPEVTLTVSEFGLVGGELAGGQTANGSVPPVRAMSLSIYQTMDPMDSVHLEYGMTGESVDYLQHSSRVSPFARVTVSAGAAGQVVASYSDGGRPDELLAHQPGDNAAREEMQSNDISGAASTLSRLPQLSYANGQLELQRTHSYEAGYNKTAGSRTYSLSAFYEDVSNGRVNVAGDTGSLAFGDLLSDGVSKTDIYNVGRYSRNGLVGTVSQHLNQSLDIAVSYGRMGGFTADPVGTQAGILRQRSHNVANARVNARLPKAGTKLSAGYGWMDDGAVIPTHVFTTQNTYISAGFNVIVRQPLPSFFGMPGHLEITADLRNLLAQGYLPIGSDGHNLLVVQSPRAVRGGLNFIF